ncbi:MAG: hypothetical protein HYV63_33030 [Candidatus Schekmanbacteria bacterium]|nr:hypothetical protein [Candidatus Schekmanbacteria bacterium]
MSGVGATLLFALALVGGFMLRWYPPEVAGPALGETGYYEADSYYHLRRMEAILQRGLSLPPRDYGVYSPSGMPDVWPPLFDFGAAAMARATGCRPEAPDIRSCLGEVAALYPVLWGVLAIALVGLLGRQLFDGRVGVTAAILTALFPPAIVYSVYARVDHHSFEHAMAAAVMVTTLAITSGGCEMRGAACLARVSGLGLALGGFLLGWMGAYAVAFPIAVAAAVDVAMATRPRALAAAATRLRDAAARALALAGGVAVAAAVASPYYVLSSRFPGSTLFGPTATQPALLLLAAVALALLAALAAVAARLGEAPGRRLVSAVLPAGALAGLGAVLASQWSVILEVFFEKSRSPAHGAWYGYASEMQSSLPDLARGSDPALVLAAVALVLLATATRHHRRGQPAMVFFVTAGLVFLALTLRSMRFITLFMPAMAVALAWAIVGAARRFVPPGPPGGRRLQAVVALFTAVILLPSLPAIESLATKRSLPLPEAPDIDLATFLREGTPDPGNTWGARPAWGVAAPADIGHLLLHVGRRPVVYPPFGGRFNELCELYLATDADAVLEILRRREVGILVTELFPHRLQRYVTLLGREQTLFVFSAAAGPGGELSARSTPELEKLLLVRLHLYGPAGMPAALRGVFRPIYASPHLMAGPSVAIPRYRAFAVNTQASSP